MKYVALVLFILFFIPFHLASAGSLLSTDLLLSPVSENSIVGQNIPLDKPSLDRPSSFIMDIPLYTQEKNLSCEAASIKMILAYFGQNVDENEIQNSFLENPNPSLGFRGNVNGPVWGFNDYGVYPDVVVKTLKKYGHPAEAYQNIDENKIKNAILSGHPVIIWVDIANPDPKEKDVQINGDNVKLISGEHTVVITGFGDGKWYLNDPWRRTLKGTYRLPEREIVSSLDETRWDLFDHMAVIVY